MGFLDSEPDLAETVFTTENLRFAQRFLRELIEQQDPQWLRRPMGPLAVQWNSEGPGPASSLVELARVLSTLPSQVSRESQPFLLSKIRGLLRASDERVFEENLAEFQVADMLVTRASPLVLEPLVPRDAVTAPSKPPSPDFAIRLPDGDVFLEVTVFRFGALDSWDRTIDTLVDEIRRELIVNGARRECWLSFPLEFRRGQIPENAWTELVAAMGSEGAGRRELELPNGPASIEWVAIPHFEMQDVPDLGERMRNATVATFGGLAGFAFASHRALSALPDSELFVRSIRNTFKRKRKQFPHDAPYVLVVKLGDYRLLEAGFADTLYSRIWSSADFAWISGACVFVPRTSFEPGNTFPRLWMYENPNARTPLMSSLRALFEGTATFHRP